MVDFYETQITKAILSAYHEKLSGSLVGDVLVVGAGPSGLGETAVPWRRVMGRSHGDERGGGPG
jgi:threonine dehydrogenase-like Zn-dependent dehydrogenase